jgi:hypothetical protein
VTQSARPIRTPTRALASIGRVALQPWIPSSPHRMPGGWVPPALHARSTPQSALHETSEPSHVYARQISAQWAAAYPRLKEGTAKPWPTRRTAVQLPPRSSWLAPTKAHSMLSTRTTTPSPVSAGYATRSSLSSWSADPSRYNHHLPGSTGASQISRYRLNSSRARPPQRPRAQLSNVPSNVFVDIPHQGVATGTHSGPKVEVSPYSSSRRLTNRWAPPNEASHVLYRENPIDSALRVPSGRRDRRLQPDEDSSSTLNIDQGTHATFEGDLVLDGTELAAWMIRQIAEALATVPTGTTGPDGRMAPTPPGTALFF